MAQLHSYYVLCPLIDQKSFLGISEDKNSENIIITLGRNVVNKYRLSDQKQIGGWTSKDHITCPVVYDKEQKSYVGVFNNNLIKMWKKGTHNLDKSKKSKFTTSILKLLPRTNQGSLLILTNGNCFALSYALDNKNVVETKPIMKSGEVICDTACYVVSNTEYICYITKTAEQYEILTCPLRDELGDMVKAKICKTKIIRKENDIHLVGKLISTSETPVVYVMWSDSKISVYDLENNSCRFIGSVSWISSASSVSMAWMGEKHLILFGSDVEQDGAIIVAFNVTLGVGSCRYPMKMYSEDAKLYCFNNRIILEASNHIGMFPYTLETSRSLSSLLGSHEVIQGESTDLADWGVGRVPLLQANQDIKELLNLGLTERHISSQIFPLLIENNDCKQIQNVMTKLKDIPENVLVLMLHFGIKLGNSENIDICDNEQFVQFCADNQSKLSFLNSVFEVPFSDALLVPYLRNRLHLNDALFLLKYLCYLLAESDESFASDYESKLLDWCMLLIDAFYQQYLLTKDNKVTVTLQNVKNIVVEFIKQLNRIDKVLPALNKLLWSENLDDVQETLPYTIELMQI